MTFWVDSQTRPS